MIVSVEELRAAQDLSAGTGPGGHPSDGGVVPTGGGSNGNDGNTAPPPAGGTTAGNDGNNDLYGTSGPDILLGNSGDDVLTGYSGPDFFDGGDGSDTVDYSYNLYDVHGTVNLADDEAFFPGFYTEQLVSIENVWMGAGNDTVSGDPGNNDLRGGPGNDTLAGDLGNDVIYGDWKYSDQGGIDTAVLSYTFGSGYTVSGSPNALHIAGPEGDDWYYNIENFQFAGGVIEKAAEVLNAAALPGSQPVQWMQDIGPGHAPTVSGDGRYLVYTGQGGIYVRDLATEVTTFLVGGGGFSSITPDGRHIAWQRTGGVSIYDQETGITTDFALDPSGSRPTISADGRYVAYNETSNFLFEGQILVRDLVNGTTVVASVSSDGTAANDGSAGVSISADGRFVAFVSLATNLVAEEVRSWQVYVHDLVSGATTLVSDGSGSFFSPTLAAPAISGDGRYIAYWNYHSTVTLYDRSTDTSTRLPIHTSLIGGSASDSQWKLSISADGRYIAFTSQANLVPEDSDGSFDIYVYDVSNETMTQVSRGVDGSYSAPPAIEC